jgi:predicted glycosyltransferase
VLGLRDILDAPERIRDEWHANDYTGVISEHYSTILCYGDPDVFDPVGEYGLSDELGGRIEFTGYLADDLLSPAAPEIRLRHAPEERLAVCTLGGGKDAAPIARSFMAAMELLGETGWRGVLITGPYMAEADVGGLGRHRARRSVDVIPVVDDVPSYLAAADAAVCMGGYNTTCEVLALAVPAVIVPRVEPRVEQLMRAERLGARRLVRWLHPATLSPAVLAGEIEQAAGLSRPALAARVSTLSHHGILTASGHLADLLPARRPTAPGRFALASRGETHGRPEAGA